MQIRTRLTLWFTSLTAMLLIGSLCFIYYLFATFTRESYYANLQSRATMVWVMFEKNNPDIKAKQPISEKSSAFLPEGENVIVFEPEGEKIFSLYPQPDEIPATYIKKIVQNESLRFHWKQSDYLGVRYVSNSGKTWAIVARVAFTSVEITNLSRILILTFFIFLIILSFAGYYFSGKVLMPVSEAMNEMDRIHPNDLSKRLSTGKNKDEMQRLTLTFNRLLDRIEEAFSIQKGFLSNFSHEVRNPIGSIIAAIQVSLSKERQSDEYKKTLKTVLQDALELENTSYQLMELARLSSRSNPTLLQPVRIDEIIWQSKATVRKLHSGYHFTFDDSVFPKDIYLITITGNESLLKVAFINLLENACKFSPDHSAGIRIFNTSSHEVCVEISDTAPTLSPQEKEWIFKPFFRTEHSKNIQGSGIGLSLVHSILSLHQARLLIVEKADTGNVFQVFFSLLSEKESENLHE